MSANPGGIQLAKNGNYSNVQTEQSGQNGQKHLKNAY